MFCRNLALQAGSVESERCLHLSDSVQRKDATELNYGNCRTKSRDISPFADLILTVAFSKYAYCKSLNLMEVQY